MSSDFRGDKGFTDLINEKDVSKADARIECIGSIDEAWAAVGFARSLINNTDYKGILAHIQNDLYILMSQLAWNKINEKPKEIISNTNVEWLEAVISNIEKNIVMPEGFIVSGDTPAGGALSLARTIVRRAERRVVASNDQLKNFDPIFVKYLNRLSSACFYLEVAEYYENKK